MEEFFKRCGIGLTVIVLSPLWLAYFALYICYSSLMLILSPLKMLFYAISKRKYTIKSHYDLMAEQILNGTTTTNPKDVTSANIPGYMFSNSPTTSFESLKRGNRNQAMNQPNMNYQINTPSPNFNQNFNPNNPYQGYNQNFNPGYSYQNNFPNQYPNYSPNNPYQNNGFNTPNNFPNQNNMNPNPNANIQDIDSSVNNNKEGN